MTRRRKIVLVLAAVFVACSAVWLVLRPKEPSYQGKSLSTWLGRLEHNYETNPPSIVMSNKTIYPLSEERTQCEGAIRHIGTNAIPFLILMLQTRDSGIKLKLIGLTRQLHWTNVHITPASERRHAAVLAFELLGPDAKSAVFSVAELFAKTDPSNRTEIADSLTRILPSTPRIPALGANHLNSPHASLSSYQPTYELSRDDLLKALGPPTVLHDKWAAYDIGYGEPARFKVSAYFCIAFSHDRVLDSMIAFNPSTNMPSPFVR